MSGRVRGRVKWFNTKKGYGFVVPDDGQDVFVHARDLPTGIETLNEGQIISFELANNKKGIRATNVLLEAVR